MSELIVKKILTDDNKLHEIDYESLVNKPVIGAESGLNDASQKSLLQYFKYIGSKDSTSKTYTDAIRASILDMDAFASMGIGLFIHWGVYAVPAGHYEGTNQKGETGVWNISYNTEWSMRDLSIPKNVYKAYESQFTGENWDAEELVKKVSDAGMSYIIITVKHHEGFSLYPTNYGNWDIRTSACRNTVLDELKTACDKYDIKLGFYYSQYWDWMVDGGFGLNHGGKWNGSTADLYTEDEHLKYCNTAVLQIQEMIEKYHPYILWYDPGTSYNDKYQAIFRNAENDHYTNIITNDRLQYNRNVGDYGTGERTICLRGNKYAESCFTLNDTWGYSVNNDNKYFGNEKVFKQFVLYTLAYGQNCLLNVGPMPDGTVPTKQIECLEEIGAFQESYGYFKNYKRVNYKSMPKWGYMIELENNQVLCYVVAKGNTGYSTTVLDCINTNNLEKVEILTSGASSNYVIGENKVTINGLELDGETKVGVVRLTYSLPPLHLDANLLSLNSELPSRVFPMQSNVTWDFTNLRYSLTPTKNVTQSTRFIWDDVTTECECTLNFTKTQTSDDVITVVITNVETSATTTLNFANNETTTTDKVTLVRGQLYQLTMNVSGSNNSAVVVMNGLTFSPSTVIIEPTGVTLDSASLSIKKGETGTLTATVLPSNATDKSVVWSSSDETKATVNNGVVTAVETGECVITVTTVVGNKSASCNVIVTTDSEVIHPDSISLDSTTLSMTVGDTHQLTETILPTNVTYHSVTWSSNDETIATVENGLVRAVGEGTATITVTTVDGGKTATCSVTVDAIHPTSVVLDASTLDIIPGYSNQLTATVYPTNASHKEVSWSSSNPNVATVSDDGLVFGKTSGTTTITVTTVDGGKTATCDVTVEAETYDYLFEELSLDGSADQGDDTGIKLFSDEMTEWTLFGYVHDSKNPNTDSNATLYQCVVNSSPWTGLRIDADNNNYPSASYDTSPLVPRLLAGTDNYINTINGNVTSSKPKLDRDTPKQPVCFSRSGNTYKYTIDGVNWTELTGLATTQLTRLKDCVLTIAFDYKRSSGSITTTKYRFLKTDNPVCVALKNVSEYPFYTLYQKYPFSPTPIECEDITVDTTPITLNQGGTSQISAQVVPSNCTSTIEYTSSNANIASVSSTGLISYVGDGSATITLTCDSVVKTISVTCESTVSEVSVTTNLTGVTISPVVTTLNVGDQYSSTLSVVTEGEILSGVNVTMGGTDVTESVYNNTSKTISITSVTGDIVITAKSVAGHTMDVTTVTSMALDGVSLTDGSSVDISNETKINWLNSIINE